MVTEAVPPPEDFDCTAVTFPLSIAPLGTVVPLESVADARVLAVTASPTVAFFVSSLLVISAERALLAVGYAELPPLQCKRWSGDNACGNDGGSDQGQESKFSHVGPSEFHTVFEMTPSFHLSIWYSIIAVKEVF